MFQMKKKPYFHIILIIVTLLCSMAIKQDTYGEYITDSKEITFDTLYTGAVSKNENRWYKFTIPESGYIYLDIPKSDNIISAYLWYNDKELKDSITTNYNSNLGIYKGGKGWYILGGTYYICITQYSSTSNINYSFSLSYTASNESFAETRDNRYDGDFDYAKSLDHDVSYTGVLCDDDIWDLYQFTFDSDITTVVKITAIEGSGAFSILNPNGKDITKNYYTHFSQDSTIFSIYLPAGKYYFWVRRGDVSSYTKYTFSIGPYYTQTQKFVIRLYEKCLGRSPDASGLEHWDALLTSKQRSGAEVAKGFVFSQEYQNKNTSNEEFVEMLYNVFMDRASDEGGKAHWVEYLNNGVSREYVFRGFAQSQEYTNICNSYGIDRGTVTLSQARDQNPQLTAYVNRMYTKALERNGEADGLNHWCRTIQQKVKTPEQVAESFINSQEFKNKNLSNEEYVKVLYRTFMGREYDQAGLEHWIGELNRGCTREEILHRFATSKEFKIIQASFGL